MNTFLRFFYEFVSVFFDGLLSIVNGFTSGLVKMFSFKEYGRIIENYKAYFNGKEKIKWQERW